MSSRRILVVEDNPLTRKMLRITLESDGYTVVEAGDGRAALAAAEQELPALVLQDLVLPDMNGFELVRQLRLLGGSSVPILALSGFLNRVGDARSIEAGFDALLLKPVEPSRLLETIRPYFPDLSGPASAGHGCRVLAVDDDSVQLKLTRLHLTQLGFEVIPATSAREALRLARASPPHVVLSDVMMPDLDVFQLCFEIRQDPLLARVPVVLASAWYETAADRQLAERVGATALVQKTPDSLGVPEALLAAAKQTSSQGAREPDMLVRLEHAQAVIRQLERQAGLSAELARRCTLQAAQISLLSGVADALALNTNVEVALRDVLAATLDAAGISKGALYLHVDDGPLRLRHEIGANQNQIRVRTRLDDKGRVVAEIEDTGPGIPPEVLPRLFTPFFTTKPRGLGTGLGLTICKRIVTSFGGEISVDTQLGRGTVFRVALTAAEPRPSALPTLPSCAPIATRRGRVLVVDDDARSAQVVSRALSPEHDVATSQDADEALARSAQGGTFDLIICDMMMPIKTGVEFFADLAERAPNQEKRIIFVTGGTFTVKAREFLDQVPNARLEKPFDLRALRAMVNRLVLEG